MRKQRAKIRANVTRVFPVVAYKKPKASGNYQS
jgi:hypothetical protein